MPTGSANVTDSKPDKPAIPEAESRPKAPELSADLGDVLQAEGLDPSDPRVTDAVRKVIAISATQQISGPLPSGQEMILYGQADPSLPDRIFEDAEIRRDHRHKLEVLDSEAENRRLDRAQWAAISLAGLSIAAAVALNLAGGSAWLSAVIVLVGIGGPNVATVLARLMDRWRPSN